MRHILEILLCKIQTGTVAMTEAQTWAAIGVLAAAFFATLTLISTLFVRVVRAEIGGLRGEIGGLRAEMNARFDTTNERIDALDRDVSALMRHTFGIERD